ncbi:MAG: c-type cytochrome, partial [Arenicellales bacterium]
LGFTCAGCHGTNGASTGPATPSIGGMSEIYMIDAMTDYKNGDRPSTIMTRIAKGYSDEEIVAMSKFFADQPYVRANQVFDAAMAAKGKDLHEDNCSKCHDEGGTLADDDAGFLKGQWSNYIAYSFEDFHSGDRDMPKKMKKKMKKVSDNSAKMSALIEYYKSN